MAAPPAAHPSQCPGVSRVNRVNIGLIVWSRVRWWVCSRAATANWGRCSDGSVETTTWLNISESQLKPQHQKVAPPTVSAAAKTKHMKGEETDGRGEELKVSAAVYSSHILPAFLQ